MLKKSDYDLLVKNEKLLKSLPNYEIFQQYEEILSRLDSFIPKSLNRTL